MSEIFSNGSRYLGFDCDINTKTYKEFKYLSEKNSLSVL